MSTFTREYLSCINYEIIKYKRTENFRRIAGILREYNKLDVIEKANVVPMVYPLLPVKRIDRNLLVKRKVYVPQWWKWIMSRVDASAWEKELSENLLPLPIDHRYGEKDMERLGALIKELLRSSIM